MALNLEIYVHLSSPCSNMVNRVSMLLHKVDTLLKVGNMALPLRRQTLSAEARICAFFRRRCRTRVSRGCILRMADS